jgi:tRNA ligase
MSPPVRLLALYWPLDQPAATIHRVCCDRVLYRGENHQTLRADIENKVHEEVVWKFITGTEELLEGEVDASIEIDLTLTLAEAVQRAVDGCVGILGVPTPSPEKISEAIDIARAYAVSVKKETQKSDSNRSMPRYFGLLPEINLEEIIGMGLEQDDNPSEFWEGLKKKGRLTKRPHVTIVHQNNVDSERELWERCLALNRLAISPTFKFTLGSIVWDDRVMAATVEHLSVDTADGEAQKLAQEFISDLSQHVKDRLHITVGTCDAQVPAIEAIALLENWKAGRKGRSTKLDGVVLHGRMKGLFS